MGRRPKRESGEFGGVSHVVDDVTTLFCEILREITGAAIGGTTPPHSGRAQRAEAEAGGFDTTLQKV